ncbi:MAG: hypothetical protein ABSA93_00730 [Streptosporangiaceae bacterium]|jgi:hypothetical protein
MEDVVLIATMIGFFLAAVVLVKLLDKMIGGSREPDEVDRQ